MRIASLVPLFATLCQATSPEDSFGSSLAGAVYFLRVDPAGSSIVSIESDASGLLEVNATKSTSTGGNGLQAQNYSSPTLGPVTTEPLLGQGAVAVGDNVSSRFGYYVYLNITNTV